jgi:hypothetical protein
MTSGESLIKFLHLVAFAYFLLYLDYGIAMITGIYGISVTTHILKINFCDPYNG